MRAVDDRRLDGLSETEIGDLYSSDPLTPDVRELIQRCPQIIEAAAARWAPGQGLEEVELGQELAITLIEKADQWTDEGCPPWPVGYKWITWVRLQARKDVATRLCRERGRRRERTGVRFDSIRDESPGGLSESQKRALELFTGHRISTSSSSAPDKIKMSLEAWLEYQARGESPRQIIRKAENPLVLDVLTSKEPDPPARMIEEEEAVLQNEAVAWLLDHIPVQLGTVLRLRLGLGGREPMSLQQVGAELGISRQTASNRYDLAIGQLKQLIDESANHRPMAVPALLRELMMSGAEAR